MTTRRTFLLSGASTIAAAQRRRPNVLLITADDMNCDAPGAFGGLKDLTPNIDRLAAQGMRFERAHVSIAVCQPSRSVWMTGRYPHRNGAEGFHPINPDVPTLGEQLSRAGYRNGILSKNAHLAPRTKFHWDTYVTASELGQGRNPSLYYRHAKAFIEAAKANNQPFFLMANSDDPHRPFAGSAQERARSGKQSDYTRRIEPSEAKMPGFLPDIPKVRQEVAEYLTSVHRCDQTVGEILRALSESGLEQETLVMFMSDNGMAFPFAKTNCYLNSTRTPWIVRWPGRVKAGTVDRKHFISGIDFTPTVLDVCGLAPLEDIDGRSFLPVLQGQAQTGRDRVFTVFHETSARKRFEMRCVQNERFGYIFNGWVDGQTEFRNESQNGLTFTAMREAAADNANIAARVKHFLYRTPEELYDFSNDPNALRNLAADPAHRAALVQLRRELREWMGRTGDSLLPKFESSIAG